MRRVINYGLGFRNFSDFLHTPSAEGGVASDSRDPAARRIPGPHDRARGGVRLDRAVQPRVQGTLRHDADGVSPRARLRVPRARCGAKLRRFRNRHESVSFRQAAGRPHVRASASPPTPRSIAMRRLVPVLVCLAFAFLACPAARSASRLVGELPRAGDRPLESLARARHGIRRAAARRRCAPAHDRHASVGQHGTTAGGALRAMAVVRHRSSCGPNRAATAGA